VAVEMGHTLDNLGVHAQHPDWLPWKWEHFNHTARDLCCIRDQGRLSIMKDVCKIKETFADSWRSSNQQKLK
jgi:hypothetical protein